MPHRLWGGCDITSTQETFVVLPFNLTTDLLRMGIAVNSASIAQQIVIKQKNNTQFSYVSNSNTGALLYIIIAY